MTDEEAKKFMLEAASKYGLEYEVMLSFNGYIEAGDSVEAAAACALYDWDI